MLIVCPFRKSQKQKSSNIFCLQAGRDRVDSKKMSSYIFCQHFCHSCVSLIFGWVTMNQTPVWEEKACAAAFLFISLGLFFFFSFSKIPGDGYGISFIRGPIAIHRWTFQWGQTAESCRWKEEFSSNFGGVWCSQIFWGRCSDAMPLLDGAKIFPNPWNRDSRVKPLFWSVRFPPKNLTRAPLWTLQTYSSNAQIHREDGLRSDYDSAAFTVPVNIFDNWEDFFCVPLRALNPFIPQLFPPGSFSLRRHCLGGRCHILLSAVPR